MLYGFIVLEVIMTRALKIAVILPCHNEELTISDTIKDVKNALKNADIFVCDNASTDRTAEVASAKGCIPI